MKILKHYTSISMKHYGAPWVAIVNKNTALPDRDICIGGFAGTVGDFGDLYVSDPEDGAIYMFGQKDHRGHEPEQGYVLYTGGEFVPVPAEYLGLALAGKLKTTFIAICARIVDNRIVSWDLMPLTSSNLPEAINACKDKDFAADLILDGEDLLKVNIPFLKERILKVSEHDVDYAMAIEYNSMINQNMGAILDAMDEQDGITDALNAQAASEIAGVLPETAETPFDVPAGCRVSYVVSAVRRRDNQHSSLASA